MYKSRVRSYRDLPLRFADFGVLHRNEFRRVHALFAAFPSKMAASKSNWVASSNLNPSHPFSSLPFCPAVVRSPA